jgi:type IV pilus assembly protein PilB
MKQADPGIERALTQLPRSNFIASPDLRSMLSGRSIPTTAAVRRILEQLGPIQSNYRVLVIGSGAGYMPALVARLVKTVVVVEREDAIARIAQTNFARCGIENIKMVMGDGENGAADMGPYDLIIAMCFLDQIDRLIAQLAPDGRLFCLEGPERLMPSLVRYQAEENGKVLRVELGMVNFSRDSGEILIDLGYVDEKALYRANEEARRRKTPVINVVREQLHLDDVDFFRNLAKQQGMEFRRADEVLPDVDFSLFHRFSKTFLENQRLLPIRIWQGKLEVVTDNPDADFDDLNRMHDLGVVHPILVTSTDFRRIWSALELTRRSSQMLSWQQEPAAAPRKDDLLESSNREISHYLVSVYEAILLDAVSANASDVHVERYHDRIRIRIRADGELHDLVHYKLTPRDHAGLINVIKVRAEINIAERACRRVDGSQCGLAAPATTCASRSSPHCTVSTPSFACCPRPAACSGWTNWAWRRAWPSSTSACSTTRPAWCWWSGRPDQASRPPVCGLAKRWPTMVGARSSRSKTRSNIPSTTSSRPGPARISASFRRCHALVRAPGSGRDPGRRDP